MHILWDSNPEAPREIKNWLVRLTKAESQAKLLGLQIKMLAWIKCLVKILKLSFSFHLVEYLLRHHVNAGKSLTWCGTVQPPMSWLAFGTLFKLLQGCFLKVECCGMDFKYTKCWSHYSYSDDWYIFIIDVVISTSWEAQCGSGLRSQGSLR